MYLKSIEVNGFKSFANKILFEFHNGITGIVGPNGSGKSNVADAVRWVLGEQSAKQLRGASMQDVIFAGTESRKPLSYAYVAITLDNTDHKLPIDYEEVTIARRVYRSGESEYLLNGSPCRLKDVHELFYDTGIGKEGYSIIGQGQIEKILNGKPEERRELFDEAAGIVKYKRRKVSAEKKLESERENLIRIRDILQELERQVGPLEKQSEKAKVYLQHKEELKKLEINLFLREKIRLEEEETKSKEVFQLAKDNLEKKYKSQEALKKDYEQLEEKISQSDETISHIRNEVNEAIMAKEKLEGQINVLQEKIKASKDSIENVKHRRELLLQEKKEKETACKEYLKDQESIEKQLEAIEERKMDIASKVEKIQEEVKNYLIKMEDVKKELKETSDWLSSRNEKTLRFKTMQEQMNIQKAKLNQQIIKGKSEEAIQRKSFLECEARYEAIGKEIQKEKSKEKELKEKQLEWNEKYLENRKSLENQRLGKQKYSSNLESLRNIAERYDGYGNSIRKVMEKRGDIKGIIGVVADIIKVEEKYEVAIETALGGNIQNIVTEDELVAKKYIQYLKEHRYGRATFLPLTSVKGKPQEKNDKYLKEKGVIGYGNTLVQTEDKFQDVIRYLLGRVLVVEHIDDAIALAKASKYSLHIVTLEGEYLSPGGSMAGGAYKNSSNLLGRKREIEQLQGLLTSSIQKIQELEERENDIQIARDFAKEDLALCEKKLQGLYLQENTEKINYQSAKQQQMENRDSFEKLKKEYQELEEELANLLGAEETNQRESKMASDRKQELEKKCENLEKQLEEKHKLLENEQKELNQVQLEGATCGQKKDFIREHIKRVQEEQLKLAEQEKELENIGVVSSEEIDSLKKDIERIRDEIKKLGEAAKEKGLILNENIEKKEELGKKGKEFFHKNEELLEEIGNLDKEVYRLNIQREKIKEQQNSQINYLWNEYEVTPGHAKEYFQEEYEDVKQLKSNIFKIKDLIKSLGNVNINAIEDFKEIHERYTFLKNQHDDVIEAEKALVEIIADLDVGMKQQFQEKFLEIQKEFDQVFKELFGGGKGTLELQDQENLLECGVKIIAQPPGKKLQNMMQLSGGEKSLTAIALLFAIQNLKPSPFCLLDEIEAALDDSNVGRFATYLNKLTKHTQFIIITHRRGTMHAADRLYGITMQEKGVSTLVSVSLIEHELDKKSNREG